MNVIRFLILALGACVAPLLAQQPSPEPSTAVRPDAANYVLQPSDLIQVRIFQEPDLDRELRVSQDHTITLPLIGQISIRDKSPRQVEMEIRELYDRDFLVNPQVNVSVVQYALRSVSVLGMVNQPGPVAFPPEEPLRLIDAIARAGGFNRLANPSRVSLTRKNPDGTSETFTVNAEQLIRGTSAEPWFLQRDDVINVPERIF